MILKKHKQLKAAFIADVIFMIAIFVISVLYSTKYVTPIENTGLERWAILITMAGIVATLKFLHPRLNDSDRKEKNAATKKYSRLYLLRLMSLLAIFSFNIVSLYLTASKNFVFLAFITIFAVFLCTPSLKYTEAQINGIDDNDNSDI